MNNSLCPSLSALLINGQRITHRSPQRGWIETPDGRYFQPLVRNVQFIRGMDRPLLTRPQIKRRRFLRLTASFL